jgi:hypothetical protein
MGEGMNAKLKASYIDNGHYRISDRYAGKIALQVTKVWADKPKTKMPRRGYERKIYLTEEQAVDLFGDKFTMKGWWLCRTQLSYHDGKTIKRGWVWALHG